MSLIATDSLTRRYGSLTALDALTVAIEPGITGLVGANGAGKSTLIKVLLGLLEPSEGRAAVLGNDVVRERAAIRRLVGYMPEHDCLAPDVSAADFVAWLGRCSGLPYAAARERTAEVLRHVGLFEERYRAMGGYSTGMQQRVKLAQALVHDPRILILDEPTNGLDPAGRDEMLALIARTGREFGISVLVSSHLLGELERICDAIVLIENGRLIRADHVGAVTVASGTLVLEVDGDSNRFVDALLAAGLDALTEHERIAVRLAGSDDESMQRTCDVIRDTAAVQDVGLLRLEQRRGHLEDLFVEAARD